MSVVYNGDLNTGSQGKFTSGIFDVGENIHDNFDKTETTLIKALSRHVLKHGRWTVDDGQ